MVQDRDDLNEAFFLEKPVPNVVTEGLCTDETQAEPTNL